jgi:hypothetical protein
MKFLIDKIFGSDTPKLPSKVKNSFKSIFRNYKNDEWSRRDSDWEVVFYHGDREKIALFDETGLLKEQKSILDLDCVPENVAEKVRSLGEMMNAIEIKNDNLLSYEIIYRDNGLVRHLAILSAAGDVIRSKIL